MTTSTRIFWWCGVVGVGMAALLAGVGGLGWVPFVNDLVRRGGPPGLIATAVLGTTLWVLFALLAGARQLTIERRLTNEILARTADSGGPTVVADLESLGLGATGFANPEFAQSAPAEFAESRIARRYRLFRDRHGEGDRDLVGFLLSARSGVDTTRAEIPYGPVRALVWALPALGFLGTAAELSSSIGGVGAAIARTSSYGDLRDFLAQSVIPPLANAFGITLFALACSVVCHVLLSIAHAREQRLAVAVDDWALDEMARLVPPSTADQVVTINGDIDRLSREVATWRTVVIKATDATSGGMGGAVAALSRLTELAADIGDQLDEIAAKLDRELVVRPVARDRGVAR